MKVMKIKEKEKARTKKNEFRLAILTKTLNTSKEMNDAEIRKEGEAVALSKTKISYNSFSDSVNYHVGGKKLGGAPP